MNTYYIIKSSDLDLVDFSKTIDNRETVRLNVEKTKAIVRWQEHLTTPCFMKKIKGANGPYDRNKMRGIILEAEWNEPPIEEDYGSDYEPLTFEDAMNKSEEE